MEDRQRKARLGLRVDDDRRHVREPGPHCTHPTDALHPRHRNAAQLDVNYSYPRFLVYERASDSEPPKAKSGLIPDLKFTSWEYVSEASPRDFFYLTRHRVAS